MFKFLKEKLASFKKKLDESIRKEVEDAKVEEKKVEERVERVEAKPKLKSSPKLRLNRRKLNLKLKLSRRKKKLKLKKSRLRRWDWLARSPL